MGHPFVSNGSFGSVIMEGKKKNGKKIEWKSCFIAFGIEKKEEKVKKHTWDPPQTFLLSNAKKTTEKQENLFNDSYTPNDRRMLRK